MHLPVWNRQVRFFVVGGGVLDAPRKGKAPLYNAKDKGAIPLTLRAGHARPLRLFFPQKYALIWNLSSCLASSTFRCSWLKSNFTALQSSVLRVRRNS